MELKSNKMKNILLGLIVALCGINVANAQNPSTYVIVHGAWGGAWQFKKTANELEKLGNTVYRANLTGLGDRAHLADTSINLKMHIQDVISSVNYENLTDIILIGHSYGGMVITGVADSIPDRIQKVIYLDAFLPENGNSATDEMGEDAFSGMVKQQTKNGFINPWWIKDETKYPKDVPHPVKTLTDKILLPNTAKREKIPTTYLLTYDSGTEKEKDGFYKFYQRAQSKGFKTIAMEASHNPQIDKLDELVRYLNEESKP
jgi:pimeloyl-ACP methyl ester carboxylesterase